MKTAFVLATMVSMAAADCHFSGEYKKLSVSATIPTVTTISESCCAVLESVITNALKDPDRFARVGPGPVYSNMIQHECQSFVAYMQQWVMQHQGQPPPKMVASLPAGFEFKESEAGDEAPACTLHASMGPTSVSCDIPASTTITSDCCDGVQEIIAQPPSPQEGQQLQQELMTKCQSVVQWGQQRFGKVGLPKGHTKSPSSLLKWLSKILPAGMSCTEGTGPSNIMLNAILKVVEISKRSDMQELGAQPASSSLLPTIFVAGTAGALGGLVAFFAVSKLSSKPQRVSLISDDA
jgi:hypothetical protein